MGSDRENTRREQRTNYHPSASDGKPVGIYQTPVIMEFKLLYFIVLSSVRAVEKDKEKEDIPNQHWKSLPSYNEHPSSRPKANDRHDQGEDNSEGMSPNSREKPSYNIPIDPFSLHHPFVHSSVAEFEYSEWYYLLFQPMNTSVLDQPLNIDSLIQELVSELATKLQVPASMFIISCLEEMRPGLGANLSLSQHTVAHLHHNLCRLQQTSPIFQLGSLGYRLTKLLHDKNQHLYIRTNQSSTTTGDQLGLLLTLTLGGLGMFLLVMAFSFLAAQIISRQDLTGIPDMEDNLVEDWEGEVIDNAKEIFIIDNAQNERVDMVEERSRIIQDNDSSLFIEGLQKNCETKSMREKMKTSYYY